MDSPNVDISEEYQIRRYASGDEQEIVDLLSHVFTEWKSRGDKALDHWRWKYQDNPWGPCTIAVAVRGDKIVGVAHDVYFYSKIGDTSEKTVYGTDVAVHTEHRRKGIHTRMLEFRRSYTASFGFRYGYTTNKILIDSTDRKRREGDDPFFRFPVDINRYLLIRDVDLHLEKKKTDNPWLKKQGYNIKKWISSIQSSLTRMKSGTCGIEIREGFDLDEAAPFWDKIQSKYNFIAMKNRDYLEWRFLDPRSGDYHILSAYREGEYCGYVVANIDHETPNYPMGNIVDLLLDEDEGVGRMLLQKALSWLENREINAVSAYAVKGSQVSHLLETCGFMDRGDSLYCTYKIPGRSGETHPVIEQLNVDNVHLMYSDYYVK